MARDNHQGPMFAEVQSMYPQATRFHWFQNAFDASDQHWLVATPIECGGGPGMFWKTVKLQEVRS